MKRLVIGTRNAGKLQEFSAFLSDLPLEIVSLRDVGITDDVEEDGKTYEENSAKKALFYARKSKLPTIADDGGIEIAALNNAPGVYSKRWVGKNATDAMIIARMEEVERSLKDNRRAKYVTVITLAFPDGQITPIRGEVSGIITKQNLSTHIDGYPYDLFFYLPKLKKYYHDPSWTAEEINKYNHRAKALIQLKRLIRQSILER